MEEPPKRNAATEMHTNETKQTSWAELITEMVSPGQM